MIKRTIVLLLLISYSGLGYSQIIKGRIRDQYTDSTINYAAVYFNGTLDGTIADENGYFELDVSKNVSMPLTISALGIILLTSLISQVTKYFHFT